MKIIALLSVLFLATTSQASDTFLCKEYVGSVSQNTNYTGKVLHLIPKGEAIDTQSDEGKKLLTSLGFDYMDMLSEYQMVFYSMGTDPVSFIVNGMGYSEDVYMGFQAGDVKFNVYMDELYEGSLEYKDANGNVVRGDYDCEFVHP